MGNSWQQLQHCAFSMKLISDPIWQLLWRRYNLFSKQGPMATNNFPLPLLSILPTLSNLFVYLFVDYFDDWSRLRLIWCELLFRREISWYHVCQDQWCRPISLSESFTLFRSNMKSQEIKEGNLFHLSNFHHFTWAKAGDLGGSTRNLGQYNYVLLLSMASHVRAPLSSPKFPSSAFLEFLQFWKTKPLLSSIMASFP